jgi:hypothetical protein
MPVCRVAVPVILESTSCLKPLRRRDSPDESTLPQDREVVSAPIPRDEKWFASIKELPTSDFVSASLVQLKAAAQFPGSGISEVGINAALAQIEALAPQNEVEAALAVQMACTHAAATSVLARFGGGAVSDRRVIALASAAARLLRAYSGQVETLRRLRHGGDQYVRVEHVHVNEGGQALIGNVQTQDGSGQPTGPGDVG